MKKSIVLGILGLVAGVASSFGQSGLFFANYDGGAISTPITYAANNVPAGKAGLALGSSFSVQLWYLNGATWTALAGSDATFFAATDGDLANGAGFFNKGALVVPLPAGANQFEVYAFNTVTVGGFAPGTITGFSNPFTVTTVDTQNPNYPNFAGTGYQGFTVSAVPEPSTLALAGIGSAALMILRRRKA